MRIIRTPLSVALIGIALAAFGCQKAPAPASKPDVALGFKPLAVENLSPEDLTKSIVFVPGSLINIKHVFADDKAVASALGYPPGEFMRTAIIRRFAPVNYSEIEWRMDVKNDKGISELVGTLVGVDLKSAHETFLPALWRVGDRNALGTSALWLSREVYENLSKSGFSTFDFGLLNSSLMGQISTSTGFLAEAKALKAEADRISDRTDVRLTKVTESKIDWPLKVNGKDVKVKVFKAKNWFGEMVVLDSQQDPLVLKVTLNNLPGAPNLSKMLDYEITELRDIQD
jgi:hypothetical protein